METRANHIVIGLFALAVIAAGMAFIYWVAEIGGQDESAEVIFQFNGPVNGLSAGSPVLFNGIQVGEVRTLSLNPNNPQEALALADGRQSATPVRSIRKPVAGYHRDYWLRLCCAARRFNGRAGGA
jgi:phospholipid/cholesterol/gamma-HCH transport system substrate-binding protein